MIGRSALSRYAMALAAGLSLVPAVSCRKAGVPAATPGGATWSWHELETELHQPRFSTAGNEIAVVRKRHVPDGHEGELVPDARTDELFRRIERDERYADPQVIVLEVGRGNPSPVGWGWGPSFSRDGGRVAYSHQTKPISRFRILAETLRGNEIRLYDRSTNLTETIAQPDAGFLAEPVFSPDGKSVVYSVGDATNGAYGGNVGIGRVNLESKSIEVLYAPSRDHGLFHVVDGKTFISGRLLALRAKPDGPGVYVADAYVYDLIDVGPPAVTVFSWGRYDKRTRIPIGFGPGPRGSLLVYDGGWRRAESETVTSPTVPQRNSTDDPGTLSPDGRLLAVWQPSRLSVADPMTGEVVGSWSLAGKLQAMVWSSDARHLATVTTQFLDPDEDIFAFDQLSVFSP